MNDAISIVWVLLRRGGFNCVTPGLRQFTTPFHPSTLVNPQAWINPLKS